jgi:hypothetical protein
MPGLLQRSLGSLNLDLALLQAGSFRPQLREFPFVYVGSPGDLVLIAFGRNGVTLRCLRQHSSNIVSR